MSLNRLGTKVATKVHNLSRKLFPLIEHHYYPKYIEKNTRNYPKNISYKKYLNRLDKEKGMILELIWRQPHFKQMSDWNFDNPQIIEVKYEEIIGNETESFRKIFEHYQFHPQLLQRGLKIVEQFSLKNMLKSDTGHVRKGTRKQWTQEFSPLVRALFEETNGDLLIKLGY